MTTATCPRCGRSSRPDRLHTCSVVRCEECRGTGAVNLDDGNISLGTVPCVKCRSIDLLCHLIKESGLRVTFDSGRNYTHPCTFCATTKEPRKLLDIGTYPNGDTLTRPVCDRCAPIVDARKPKDGA